MFIIFWRYAISKPIIHAHSSARRYGGRANEYLEIHDFLDSSKAHLPDNRHRCVLHSSFGIFITERVFGTTIKNSDGKDVSVRAIAEDHVIEDLGVIPTLQDYLEGMELKDWMQRATQESYPSSSKEIMAKRRENKVGYAKSHKGMLD